MQGFAVPLLEGGGDPGLLPKRFPQTCPAFVDSALLEFPADQLHRLILIVRGDALAFLFEPSDELVDSISLFSTVRFLQICADFF